MPNREVVIKVTTQTEGAESGMKAVGESVKGVGKAATEAKAGLDPIDQVIDKINKSAEAGTLTWHELNAEFAKLPKPLADVGKAAVEAQIALKKMEEAGDKSPRALATGAAAAQIKVEALKKALDDAQRSGVKVGPDIAAAIKVAEAEIQKASISAAKFRDTLGDMKKAADISATGFEAARSSAGSFDAMLSRMVDTSTGWVGSASKMVLGGASLVSAFMLGLEAGQKFDEFLKKHGINLGEIGAKYILAASGVKDYGEKIKDWNIQGMSNLAIHNRQKQAISDVTAELAKHSSGLSALMAEQQKGKDITNGLSAALSAFGTNAKAQQEWVKQYGKALDDELLKAIRDGTIDTNKLTEAQKHLVKQIIEAGDAAQKAAEKIVASKKKEVEEIQKATSATIAAGNAKIKALTEEALSDEEFNKRKKAIAAEMIAAMIKEADKTAELRDLEKKKLGEVDESYKGVEATVGDLSKRYEESHEATKKTAEAQDRVKSGIDAMTLSAKGGGEAITATGKAMTGLSDVATKSNDVTKKSSEVFDDLGKSAKAVGGELPKVADGFAKSDASGQAMAKAGVWLGSTLDNLNKRLSASVSELDKWTAAADRAAEAASRAAGAGAP